MHRFPSKARSGLTAWILSPILILAMQFQATVPGFASDAIIIDSEGACARFLAVAGGVGSATAKTCTVSASSGAGPVGIPPAATVTISSGWTLELADLEGLGGFTVAGTLDVNGALYVRAGWRSDPAPELAVHGTLRNTGVVRLQDGSLDLVAAHIVNNGRIVNSGSLSGGIVNNGQLVNTRAGTLMIGERRFLLANSGSIVNRGELVIKGPLVEATASNTGTITNSATGRLTIATEMTLFTEGTLISRGRLVNNGGIAVGCGGTVKGKVKGNKPFTVCVKTVASRVNIASAMPNQVRVSWHATKAAAFDVEYRLVDGALQSDFTRWLSLTSARSATFTGTQGATYQFRTRMHARGQAWAWSPLSTTTLALDERAAGEFSDGWTDRASPRCYAGTCRVATGSGKTWTVTDYSRSVWIYGTTNPKGARARIYIDDHYVKTVSTYSHRTHYRQRLYKANLAWGEHTITVISRKSGTHNKLILDAYAPLR